MFFLMGITQKQDKLQYNSKLIIHDCNTYGHIEVYMFYNVLSLFLIPIFKWNKKYFVKFTCCGAVYDLNPEIGKAIEHGENPNISKNDLIFKYNMQNDYKYCENCHQKWEPSYEYCPKCGEKL